MNRQQCLDKASKIVNTDRNSKYGEPENNFADIAAYWTTYLRKKLKTDMPLTAPDVAIMSALIKVSRLQNTPDHEDSWIDIAGYAACGVQCATETQDKTDLQKWREENFDEPESIPVLRICGCPLNTKNFIVRGADWYCGICGQCYPKPERREERHEHL